MRMHCSLLETTRVRLRREHRTSGNEFNKQIGNFVHNAAAGGIGRHCGEARLWGDIPADRPTPDVSASGRMLCGPGGSVQRGSESGGVAVAHFRAYILSQIHYISNSRLCVR